MDGEDAERIAALAEAIARARTTIGDAAADEMTCVAQRALKARGAPAGLFEYFHEDLDDFYQAERLDR